MTTTDPLMLQIKSLREPLGTIAREKLDAITAEVERMQHDIDRHVGIAADLATENEKLRAERDYWITRASSAALGCDRLRAERDAARERTLALTPEEVEALVEFSGAGTDDGAEITIGWLDQHEGGAGWYAWLVEYPEEGSVAVKLPCDDHNQE